MNTAGRATLRRGFVLERYRRWHVADRGRGAYVRARTLSVLDSDRPAPEMVRVFFIASPSVEAPNLRRQDLVNPVLSAILRDGTVEDANGRRVPLQWNISAEEGRF